MNDDKIPQALYLVLFLVVVGSSLAARRLPLKDTAKMALAWVGIFALGIAIVAFKDEWKVLGTRMTAAITGGASQGEVAGGELRIPVRDDGHFWIRGMVNGVPVDFLIDSGATTTTVEQSIADEAKLETGLRVEQVDTANGSVVMKHSEANSLQVGPIVRSDFPVLIAPQEGLNVLGMNFLGSLRGWRSDGRTLVLIP
ncbi:MULTISPECIES: retropepsin-like aspartic protease family protein [Sphingomonas]|uniref:retropepsin-like aspartic protease family protein n=1 Tax=Sphingomonas TaxID=13687 RepID=UPI000DEF6546|nr:MULTISPECIES: TIGR02281 family clan AA aspartic protease [Sphingomonas]